MKDYYAEFLQRKNSGYTLYDEVSKVSKPQNLTQKQAFDTFDTTLSRVNQKNSISEIKLHERINQMITSGALFDVAIDDFNISGANNLSQSEKDFLNCNKVPVLCTLQQALLVKHLFSHSPEQLEDFAFEIRECESILLEGSETSREAYFYAVREVTGKWFARLLDTISR